MLSRLYKSAIYSNAIVEADGKTAPTKHECTSVQSLKKESPNLGILARLKKIIKGLININSFKGSHNITKHHVDEPYDSSINNSAYNDARVQRCKFAPFYN